MSSVTPQPQNMEGTWYQTPNGQPYFVPTPSQASQPQTPSYPWLPSQQNRPYAVLPQSQPSLNGRIVNSLDDIKPQEIKMDGSISLFPTSDFQRIYAKQWNSNGVINTIEYIPVLQNDSQAKEDLKAYDDILTKLDSLDDYIRKSLPIKMEPAAG